MLAKGNTLFVPGSQHAQVQHAQPTLSTSALSMAVPRSPTINIVMLGDGAVGKTALGWRFGKNTFPAAYRQTKGLDIYSDVLTFGEESVMVQLWDISGHNLPGKFAPNILHQAHAILFVYDITHAGSFLNVEEWIKLVHRVCIGGGDFVPINPRDPRFPYMALVGNKNDLGAVRTVKAERHQLLANDYGMQSFFVSAKTGEGIKSCINRIAADIMEAPSGLTSAVGSGYLKFRPTISPSVLKLKSNPELKSQVLLTKNMEKKPNQCTIQ